MHYSERTIDALLQSACIAGALAQVAQLLKQGANANAWTRDYRDAPLHLAASHGHVQGMTW
jgi:ankyrin repeat protein